MLLLHSQTWVAQAWGAALVLILIMLGLNLFVKLIIRKKTNIRHRDVVLNIKIKWRKIQNNVRRDNLK